MPYNFFEEFKLACQDSPLDVIPIGETMVNSDRIFNLRTKKDLRSFIANNGLEELTYINKKIWEKNPHPEEPVQVYAYRFRTRAIPGYIAIMFSEKTKKWLIKSFHTPNDINTAMLDAFQKALDASQGER